MQLGTYFVPNMEKFDFVYPKSQEYRFMLYILNNAANVVKKKKRTYLDKILYEIFKIDGDEWCCNRSSVLNTGR